MKQSNPIYSRFLLPNSVTTKHFLDSFRQVFTVNDVEKSIEEFSLLDSFECALYSRRLLAIQHKNHHINIWKEDDLFDYDLSLTIENTSAKAKYWWDFPDSSSKDMLKELLDLRALYPVYKGILKVEKFNLQDNNGKILVFCQVITITDPLKPRTPLIRQVKIAPVTGYKNQYQQANTIISNIGGFKPKLSPLDSLLHAISVVPKPFNVKPALNLSPSKTARTSAASIIALMIEKQRLLEFGIIKDIDTEFLHHFRVALRMVRAAIAQFKEVFPPQDIISLKQRFGALAKETNTLRDLDVFILDQDRYIDLIPPSLKEGLLPMFDDFKHSRIKEVKRISNWLGSKSYQNEINKLEGLFKNGYSSLETEWSEKPTINLAIKKINKRYKVIQKAASLITPETPDELIHDIRIDCKKLRYLLYFFGSMFDNKQVKIAGNHLKRLQNTLGIFNDLSVQGEFLESYLDAIEHKPKKDILLIAALGGLISTLHTMKIQERNKCVKELGIFSNKENRQLYAQTFSTKLQIEA